MKIVLKSVFVAACLLLVSIKITAQEPEKVFFVKTVPTKIQIKESYAFSVGYVVNEESDITVEVSAGPNKFWAHKAIPVKAGRGILDVKLNPAQLPTEGSGYRILLSVRARKGNWQTTRTAVDINNLEFVSEEVRIPESVSFSPLTPNQLESTNKFKFDIDYSVLKEQMIQVSIWKDKNWLGSSKKIKVAPGKGVESVVVDIDPPVEGNDYKFKLTFGEPSDFENKTTSSKERTGIYITKPAKKLTLKEINAKSIQLAINKDSEVLTLPGKSSYEFIKIIAINGQIIGEVKNTNSVNISALTKGAYFAITSEEDYYKFVKL